MSETISIDLLKERFPSEIVNPYGEVLVIPSRLFQREWESSLKAQGYQVYSGSFGGEATFFVRLTKRSFNSNSTIEPSKAKIRYWTSDEEQRLRDMVKHGMSSSDIAKELGRTEIAVEGKIQRLRLTHLELDKPKEVSPNANKTNEDHIRELLQATLQLFPKFPYACHVLLTEAASKLKAI